MSTKIRTTEYNCCWQHSLCTITHRMKPQKKHLFWVNYEYNSKIWHKLWAHRSQSQKAILNIVKIKKLHKDLANKIQQQIEQTTEIKSFVIEEKVYLRTNNIHVKQRSKKLNNKSIKSFEIKRNIKRLSYELNLLRKMQIHSVFHAFMLQHCNQFISL